MAKRRTRPNRSKSSSKKPVDPSLQRLNKVLAAAGLGSRRDVEELIIQGRVEIDGDVVTDLACRVNPSVAKIKVDSVALKKPRPVYYALNKPTGVLSTNHDPSGRARVVDFVPDQHRVFSVGRLDRNSEGLMLLTNDGDLAQRLAHPRFKVQKAYFVVVAGMLSNEELAKLRKGVYLAEGVARIDGAKIRKHRKGCTELEILLSEGKNREIRRILARAGHKVVLLRRIAIGPLRLGQLPVGAARELTSSEVKALYLATEVKQSKPRGDKEASPSKTPTKRKGAPQTESSNEEAAKPTKIVRPLENIEDDDFGLGLEENYTFDESQLSPDAVEFGGEFDDEWDDDFVSDFSHSAAGSVLSYDEDEFASTQDEHQKESGERKSRRSSPGAASRKRATGGKGSTSGGKRAFSNKTRGAVRSKSKSAVRSSVGSNSKRSSGSEKDSSSRPAGRQGASKTATKGRKSASPPRGKSSRSGPSGSVKGTGKRPGRKRS